MGMNIEATYKIVVNDKYGNVTFYFSCLNDAKNHAQDLLHKGIKFAMFSSENDEWVDIT